MKTFLKTIVFLLVSSLHFLCIPGPAPEAFSDNTPRLILQEAEGQPTVATIYTTGLGKMPESDEVSYEKKKLFGRRVAIVDGYKNLLTAIQGARKYLTKENEATFNVEGYIKNVEVIETRYMKNGMVEVDLMVSVTVYDPSIVDDRSIMRMLHGKTVSAMEGIEVIEVDEEKESISSSAEILQGIQADQQE